MDVTGVVQGGVPSEGLRSRRWWIGLDSWILQDGNYTDVVAGERRQFALELGYRRAARLAPAPDPGHGRTPRCAHTGRGTSYDVCGELLRSATQPHDDAFVLDIGLQVYTQWMVLDDLEPPVAGAWLTGEIHLSVDPFFYMDDLARRPRMPALIYTWKIEAVQHDLTPQILVQPGDPRHEIPAGEGSRRIRDLSREAWRSVPRTRTWEEDGSYRLGCTLEAVAPVSTMVASGSRSPYGPLPG